MLPQPRSSAAVAARPRRVAAAVVSALVIGWMVSGRTEDGARARPERAPAQLGPTAAIDASWTRVPLGAWVRSLARLTGQVIVLDRRLDPDRLVTRECRGEPLGDLLAHVAADAAAEVAWLSHSIRIVPRGLAETCVRADRCREAAIAALPRALRGLPTGRQAWSWSDGAVPRALVAAEAAAAPVEVTGLADLPHDHLPGLELPPLSLAERLDLVLAHYDRRIDWRSTPEGIVRGVVVPLESAVDPAARPGTPPPIPRPTRRPQRVGPVTTRYTLRLAAPLDAALGAIAGRLDLTLELDREALAARGISPAEIVRAEVSEASREELLDALLGTLPLAWRIEDRRLIVTPRPGN